MDKIRECTAQLIKKIGEVHSMRRWYWYPYQRLQELLGDPAATASVKSPVWCQIGIDEFTYHAWDLVFCMAEVGHETHPAYGDTYRELKALLEATGLNCDPNKADHSDLPSPDEATSDAIRTLLKQRMRPH